MKTITFNDALEIVESLPEEQRESLIEIVKNVSQKNEGIGLAQSIKEAREEYARGDIRKGTVYDLMRETSR